MSYSKYSDDDLIESYTTMIDYSGKADDALLKEIEHRGGIDSFLKRIENKKTNHKEINRIVKEVHTLSKDYSDLEFIKKFISSDILSQQELDELVAIKFKEHQDMLVDRKIDSKTIIGSVIGTLIGSFLGFLFLVLCLYLFDAFLFFTIVGAYIICYVAIRLITKKSRNNAAVFIASALGTIIATILTFITISVLSR